MELLVVHRGAVRLEHEASEIWVREGHLALVWAAIPRLRAISDDAVCSSVRIPLATLLGWKLPEALLHRLLLGEPVLGLEGDVESMVAIKWEDDLAAMDRFVARAAELEIQACVLRLGRKAHQLRPVAADSVPWRRAMSHILTHLEDDLSSTQLGYVVGCHPNALMRSFRAQAGMTVGQFVRRHRMARAKRLLIETSQSISDVGIRSGFGSERRFFELFRSETGMSPLQFRRSHQRSLVDGSYVRDSPDNANPRPASNL